MSRLAFVSVLVTLTVSSVAWAEETQCWSRRPGDPMQCVQTQPAEVPEQGPDLLADHTHASFFPTGDTLRKGETQVQLQELGIFTRVGYGLTDRLEINAGTIFPFLGSFGARLRLTPKGSMFRATIGTSMWVPMALPVDEDLRLLQSGGTIALQGEKLNVHATVTAVANLDNDDDDVLWAYSAGAVAELTRDKLVFAEVTRFSFDNQTTRPVVTGGLKFAGRSWDVDFGVMTILDYAGDSDDIPSRILPIVGFTYKR
jgi:hypothetical protein